MEPVLMLTGHRGMAMIHHIIHNNKVLTLMLPTSLTPRKVLNLNITCITLLLAALSLSMSASAGQSVPSWKIIHDESRLGFTSNYGGVEFDGRFKKYTAEILFDPKNPEAGSFNVNIDTTSITTYSSERDSVIGDPEWFNFSKYPTSTYVTKSIKAVSGNKYVAVGTLDLKGHKKDVTLNFTWDEYPNGDIKVEGQARLLGNADVNRTDFGIGSGTWKDDDTIGFVVKVKIRLLLKKATGN